METGGAVRVATGARFHARVQAHAAATTPRARNRRPTLSAHDNRLLLSTTRRTGWPGCRSWCWPLAASPWPPQASSSSTRPSAGRPAPALHPLPHGHLRLAAGSSAMRGRARLSRRPDRRRRHEVAHSPRLPREAMLARRGHESPELGTKQVRWPRWRPLAAMLHGRAPASEDKNPPRTEACGARALTARSRRRTFDLSRSSKTYD
jgi:hypothetical protein